MRPTLLEAKGGVSCRALGVPQEKPSACCAFPEVWLCKTPRQTTVSAVEHRQEGVCPVRSCWLPAG